jgi:hypothetical protein
MLEQRAIYIISSYSHSKCTENSRVRITPAHWEKIDLYGRDWLRSLIDRAEPPKP